MIDWQIRYRELESQMEYMLLRTAEVLEDLETKALNATSKIVHMREVVIDNRQNPKEITIVADGHDLEYALYLYKQGDQVVKFPYQRSNTFDISQYSTEVVRSRAFARPHTDKSKMVMQHDRLN